MATTTKAKAATAPAEPTPTGDLLIAEAVPSAPPEGHDLLQPMHALPRRRRAELMRLFGDVVEAGSRIAQAGAALTDAAASPDRALDEMTADEIAPLVAATKAAADTFDLAADIEEALALAAIDADAFNAWSAAAPDEQLFALFNWYGGALGEATASPS